MINKIYFSDNKLLDSINYKSNLYILNLSLRIKYLKSIKESN
jgi:hypothetical protein